MTCCSEPAALQQKKYKKFATCRSNKNKEIDYDEKRNPDLPLRLLPGAGQMYQGYMKRGAFRSLRCSAWPLVRGTLLEVLYVAMPIVWMYSFFDTFNLRAQIGAGTAPQDDYLVHINWHDQRMEQFMLDSHKLLGWGLIALGALVAYQNILMNTLGISCGAGPEQPLLPCTLPDDGSAAGGGGLRGP